MKSFKGVRVLGLFISLAAILVAGGTASADYTITSGNSQANIDPTGTNGPLGMNSWTVDGTENLFQQWFWYGLGSTAGQSQINALSSPTVTQNTPSALDLLYQGDGLSLDVSYLLRGGLAGSGASDIAETITISNTSDSTIALRFYEYTDFDLSDAQFDQTVRILRTGGKAFKADQTGGGQTLSETVVGPGADRWEAALYSSILDNLDDPSVFYKLNDVAHAGPGDATWAFQWNRTLAPGETFQINKDKQLSVAPEPATLLLLGFGLFGLVGVARRRMK
jgi:hypothetical protein